MFTATQTTRDLYVIEPEDDVPFTCEIDGTEIELVAVARRQDLRDVLTEAELHDMGLIDHPFVVSLYLVPTEESVSEDTEYGWHQGEYYPEDVVRDGKGVPIDPESVQEKDADGVEERFDVHLEDRKSEVAFADWEEAEEYITEVIPERMPAVRGMVGFYLDRSWNRLGSTGWDRIRSLTVDADHDEYRAPLERATA